jgi:hypothetical protein
MRAPAHVLRAQRREQPAPASDTLRRHRDFIASLRCLACGKPPPSECARLCPALDTEASQHKLLPLCGPKTIWEDCCHSRMHFQGPSRFWSALGIDAFDLAWRLSIASGDRQAGAQLIRQARQNIAPRREHVPHRPVKARSAEPLLIPSAP